MRVKNAFLVVSDMASAVQFYQEVLCLPLQFQDGHRWTQFKVDGFTWALASPEEAALPAGSNALLTLEVDDLEATRRRLADAGIAVSAVRDMGPHGKTARFQDPDGNWIQLYEAP
ncbi:MAG: VOC family protein [Firmicutes bacterium]|nr:VOC family protein [Bacillota bacterium]